MSDVIEGAEDIVKVEGWWRVCQQSTDFLITGILTIPTTDKIDDALSAFCRLSITEKREIIDAYKKSSIIFQNK